MMSGEALIGQLPDKWKVVDQDVPQTRRFWPVFLNSDTGKTQIDDPRLGSVPSGWHIASHEREKCYNHYINNGAEAVAQRFDPRLERAALTELGTNVQMIRLV